MKNKMGSYIADTLFLLGGQRRKLPMLLALFLLLSISDLFGIGLIGGYISLLTQEGSRQEGMLYRFMLNLGWSNEDEGLIFRAGGLLVFVFAAKAVASIGMNWAILRFANGQVVRLRRWSMNILLELPYTEFIRRNSSEYIQNIELYVGQFIASLRLLLKLISEGIVAVAILLFLAYINAVALGVMIAFVSVLVMTFDKVFRHRLTMAGRAGNLANQQIIQGIQEGAVGLKEIRILGCEKYFLSRVVEASRIVAKKALFTNLVTESPKALVEGSIVIFLVALVAITYLQEGNLVDSYSLVGMFGIAVLRLGPSIATTMMSVASLRSMRHAVSALAWDLRTRPETLTKMKTQISDPVVRDFESLELRDLHFRYEGGVVDVIDGVSLTITSGESLGIIGESGSGKTTLVDLIIGLLEPTSGEIQFNNSPLKEALGSWRTNIAYLPQAAFITDDTIRRNVALGVEDEKIDNRLLDTALDQAKLSDFVEKLPDSVDTFLGENGVRLSGGQRQRVVLARALYHRRNVLILDEATSALDDETEQEIVDEIRRLKGQKTMIVIAHRLTTLQHCDRICRIDKGRIIQIGTYEQIIPQFREN
jgi:ATP-binding cassette, subfamily B, bacterial PglK